MNTTVTPPGPRPSGDGPPDDLDRLLSEYCRAQMPTPWPRLRPPAARVAPAPGRGDPLSASRLALAASLAAVLVGGWLLATRPAGPAGPSGSALDGTATRPAELR